MSRGCVYGWIEMPDSNPRFGHSEKGTSPVQINEPDEVLKDIADYASDFEITSAAAYETARYCLMDSLACGFQALSHPACTRLLGPVVPGATMPGGARVPGTSFELEPIHAAFNIGAMIRWRDTNDPWFAAEWGHPSDSLGAILAVADYLSRGRAAEGKTPLPLREVLTSMIKASEIQGAVAPTCLDHVRLARVASTAVVAKLFGASREQIMSALSNAWLDGGVADTYRSAPNTGPRKSWTAGDVTSRAVRLALAALSGEMGYEEAPCEGRPFSSPREVGSSVIENVLRAEAVPLLKKEFATSILGRLTPAQCDALQTAFADQDTLEKMPVSEFMALMVKNS